MLSRGTHISIDMGHCALTFRPSTFSSVPWVNADSAWPNCEGARVPQCEQSLVEYNLTNGRHAAVICLHPWLVHDSCRGRALSCSRSRLLPARFGFLCLPGGLYAELWRLLYQEMAALAGGFLCALLRVYPGMNQHDHAVKGSATPAITCCWGHLASWLAFDSHPPPCITAHP